MMGETVADRRYLVKARRSAGFLVFTLHAILAGSRAYHRKDQQRVPFSKETVFEVACQGPASGFS
jgi:hypothetical protein